MKKSQPSPLISIVDIKVPWYALTLLLIRAFQNAMPRYAAVAGLNFKAYTIGKQSHRTFGGIYLWKDAEYAFKWFNNAWHEEIFRKRKANPVVEHYSLKTVHSFVPEDIEYSAFMNRASILILRHQTETAAAKHVASMDGVFQVYEFYDDNFTVGLITFFGSERHLQKFVRQSNIHDIRRYRAPVLQEINRTLR